MLRRNVDIDIASLNNLVSKSKIVEASVANMKATALVEFRQTTPFQLHGVSSEAFQLLRTPEGSVRRCLKDCSSSPAIPPTKTLTHQLS